MLHAPIPDGYGNGLHPLLNGPKEYGPETQYQFCAEPNFWGQALGIAGNKWFIVIPKFSTTTGGAFDPNPIIIIIFIWNVKTSLK